MRPRCGRWRVGRTEPADSVAGGAVDAFAQWLAVEKPGQVVDEQLGHRAVAVWVAAADMRQDHNAGRGPERVVCGQGFSAEDVQNGAGEVAGGGGGDQVGVIRASMAALTELSVAGVEGSRSSR